MTLNKVGRFLRDVGSDFFKHDGLSLAAAVSFYTALSFAPLVLLLVSVGGLLGEQTKHELLGQFSRNLGPRSASVTESVVEAAQRDAGGVEGSAWRTVIGTGGLLFTASAIFGQLQASLNSVWEVAATPVRAGPSRGRLWTFSVSVWRWLRKRLLSMGLVLVVLFILLVSLVISALLAGVMPGGDGKKAVARVMDFTVSVAVATLLFAAIFKVLPDLHIPWRDVWLGALVTSLLFNVGKIVLSVYIEKTEVGSDYGEAVGGLIALLMWVYYSSVVLLLGAEITQRIGRGAVGTSVWAEATSPRMSQQ